MSNNTMLKPTILVFADLCRLWAFSRNLTNQNLEINTGAKRLTCECTAEEIEIAVSRYGANSFEDAKGQENFKLDNKQSA